MSVLCPSVIHLCFVRVTRLDSVGHPVAGPNNLYVTNTPIMLTVTPDILAGEVKDQKGGCDQLISTYRGQDILKRFNFEMDLGTSDPGLEEMMTGGAAITNTSAAVIGVQFPVPCGTQQPYVAIEAWQDLWDCDHQPSTPYQYKRWVWPASRWQRGPVTLQNDFTQPKFTGFSVGNPNWGLGIYGDQPVSSQSNGCYFFDNVLPTAACGYQTHAIT